MLGSILFCPLDPKGNLKLKNLIFVTGRRRGGQRKISIFLKFLTHQELFLWEKEKKNYLL